MNHDHHAHPSRHARKPTGKTDARRTSKLWRDVINSYPSPRREGWTAVELQCGHIADLQLGTFQPPKAMKCYQCQRKDAA